ncbi:MAG TPA: hypothetical protein VG710_06785 [Opitutus sp.]|nr:hypothetical protein [Opitutus sp.]
MSKPPHRVRPVPRAPKSSRQDFESGLRAYSAAGKAAIVAGAAVGVVSARGQTITNLTSANFAGGSLSWSISPVSLTDDSSHAVAFDAHVLTMHFGHMTAQLGAKVAQSNGFSATSSTRRASGYIHLVNVPGSVARSGSNTTRSVANLARHATVSKANFRNGGSNRIFGTHFSTFSGYPRLGGQHATGKFIAPANGHVTGYLGFKIGGANYYYGWLRVQVGADANGRPQSLTLEPVNGPDSPIGAYILSSDPNASLFGAGDYNASAIPEPANVAAGLALFALGAVGVRELRKRRQAAA